MSPPLGTPLERTDVVLLRVVPTAAARIEAVRRSGRGREGSGARPLMEDWMHCLSQSIRHQAGGLAARGGGESGPVTVVCLREEMVILSSSNARPLVALSSSRDGCVRAFQ